MGMFILLHDGDQLHSEQGPQQALTLFLTQTSFQAPTKLQQDALPALIRGSDVVMDAPTNSGKTTTACISVLQKVDVLNPQCQALILTPSLTATLRTQKVILALGSRNIHCHICTDYADLREDKMRLDKGSQIVTGTPSCVQEIIRHEALSTKNIDVVVLDRVDEMFSGGFKDVIEEIFQSIPRSAQVVFLLSKTFTELKDMTRKFMRGPVFITHDAEEPKVNDPKTSPWSTRPLREKLYEIEVGINQCEAKPSVTQHQAYHFCLLIA